jgi:hypothetical protein
MVKKICLLAIISVSLPLCAVDLVDLQNQRSHIIEQMRSIKRSWNIARIHIKMAQKASFTAYQAALPIIEKILASTDVQIKINTIVANQTDAIVNRYMSFAVVKSDIFLTEFFPNTATNQFLQQLFVAMANKACYLLLGQKLAAKVQELNILINMSQQQQPYPNPIPGLF